MLEGVLWAAGGVVGVLLVMFPHRLFRWSHLGEFENPDEVRPSEFALLRLTLTGMVLALSCFLMAGWILLFGGDGLF